MARYLAISPAGVLLAEADDFRELGDVLLNDLEGVALTVWKLEEDDPYWGGFTVEELLTLRYDAAKLPAAREAAAAGATAGQLRAAEEAAARLVVAAAANPSWAPTTALPGTAEKVAVLEARATAGLPLFHPLDAEAARPSWLARGSTGGEARALLRGRGVGAGVELS